MHPISMQDVASSHDQKGDGSGGYGLAAEVREAALAALRSNAEEVSSPEAVRTPPKVAGAGTSNCAGKLIAFKDGTKRSAKADRKLAPINVNNRSPKGPTGPSKGPGKGLQAAGKAAKQASAGIVKQRQAVSKLPAEQVPKDSQLQGKSGKIDLVKEGKVEGSAGEWRLPNATKIHTTTILATVVRDMTLPKTRGKAKLCKRQVKPRLVLDL